VDGALTATRAAYIGGCAGTSNVLAAKQLGIPAWHHAHSWVMAFDDERAAFQRTQRLSNNCIFLVDTYDSLTGCGTRLRWDPPARAWPPLGASASTPAISPISVQARQIWMTPGSRTPPLGEHDLDEHLISSLKQQRAAINVWGVGTSWSRPTINRPWRCLQTLSLRAPTDVGRRSSSFGEGPRSPIRACCRCGFPRQRGVHRRRHLDETPIHAGAAYDRGPVTSRGASGCKRPARRLALPSFGRRPRYDQPRP